MGICCTDLYFVNLTESLRKKKSLKSSHSFNFECVYVRICVCIYSLLGTLKKGSFVHLHSKFH